MHESLVLYVEAFWTSPWVCSVFVTLREKAIPFTTARSMLRVGIGAIDVLHDHTLTGTAPVLQHGTFWLAESMAIVEYLEELVPEPRVFPEDVRDRARARQLMTWVRGHDALRRERPTEGIFYPSTMPRAPLSDRAREAAEALVRVAEKLQVDSRGCVFGDRFGVVDVDLAFALMRLVAGGYPVPERVAAYTAAVWQRPAVREFVDHPRPPNPP